MIGRILKWSVAIVLVAAIPALGNSAPAAAAGPGDGAGCDAALALIKEHLPGKGRWAVLGSEGSRDDNLTAADLRKSLKKDRPSPALAAQFVGQNERNPIPACANVRSFLDQAGVVHDQKAVDALQPKPTIFGLSLPVVSADGTEALADVGADTGAHGPVGWVFHLRKDAKGRWRTTDAMVTLTN
jgi:hypothetical protein